MYEKSLLACILMLCCLSISSCGAGSPHESKLTAGQYEWAPQRSPSGPILVVVSIDEQKKARTIGGNVSQTVGGDSLQLNDDYTIDIDQSTGGGVKIYRGVLKYQPAEDSTTTASNDTKSTKISNEEMAQNQVKIKNILKNFNVAFAGFHKTIRFQEILSVCVCVFLN